MDKLYNRLPKIYRKEDTQEILRDYLQALEEGGHDILLTDIMNLKNLLDIDKCPDKFLPLLAELFGYEYSAQIPPFYQRRILKVIVDLYKRKGTQSAVKFIAREISGFDAEIVENHEFEAQDIELTGWTISYPNFKNFLVKLIAPENTSDIQLKRDIAEILINQFIPTNSHFFLVEAYFFADDKLLVRNETEDFYILQDDRGEEVKTYAYVELDNIGKVIEALTELKTFSNTENDYATVKHNDELETYFSLKLELNDLAKLIETPHLESVTFTIDEMIIKSHEITDFAGDEVLDFLMREDGTSTTNTPAFILNSTMILNSKGGFMTVTNTSNGSSYTIYD